MAQRRSSILAIFIIALMLVSVAVEAQQVKLKINDQLVGDKVSIVQGRSLMPAYLIAEYFGGKLEWDQQSKSLTIDDGNQEVLFRINKRVALVDDKKIPLEVAPKLMGDRVLVPLRFVTKIYGGKLAWNSSSKEINYYRNSLTGIKVQQVADGTNIIINTDHLPVYDLNLYYQPTRLVLDLSDVNLSSSLNKIAVNDGTVKQVRLSQFKLDPAVTRVVVDLEQMSSYSVVKNNSQLILKIRDKSSIVTSSIISNHRQNQERQSLLNRQIVIDPGHGGSDPGAIGVTGLQEERINYQIAQKVDKLLKQAGYNTVITRRKDQFISLGRRATIANELDADMFVSIHANYNYDSTINGTATYGHWYASKENWALAWYVQKQLVKKIGLKNNGLKAANFAVLRKTNVPAILVETAFLSNPREERLLKNDYFQQKVAQGIVTGIKEYYANKRKGDL